MSASASARRVGLPTTHYFLSISRGDSIRTAKVRPGAMWAFAALALLSLAFAFAGAANLALRARPPGSFGFARAAMGEVAEAPAPPGLEANRRPADLDAIEDRIRDLAARQARLERRGAMLAGLAAEAAKVSSAAPAAGDRPAADAIGAIESLAPPAPAEGAGAATDRDPGGAARAYAPSSPRLAPQAAAPRPFHGAEAETTFVPTLADAALSPDLDPKTRLDLVVRSLDRLDGRQMTALAEIDRRAVLDAARPAAILADAGLDPNRLAQGKPVANAGGPLIPVDFDPKAPAFEQAMAQTARDVSLAERLKALMPFVPLRKPLAGEAQVTSPFGYRADPFLGRLALHTGVDLLQPYGSDIRATASGRVVHAGFAGGYGDMVEIDHGFGLATLYGHMSEIDVSEGQVVAAGDLLGRLGSTGRSTGPHLHYEVRVNGEAVNPDKFLLAGEKLFGGQAIVSAEQKDMQD
jgi:murein DD-endopeptidase MepM/ murein hydrolase activator NlpD